MPATPLTDVARRLLINVENDHGEPSVRGLW